MSSLNPTTQQGLLWLGISLVVALLAGAIGNYYPGEGHDPILEA